MIKSMTGYGKAEYIFQQKKVSIDIRSVNSKQLDLSIKMPALYRDREGDLRSRIMTLLQRGKVDVFVSVENTGATTSSAQFNEETIAKYFDDLKDICRSNGIKATDGEMLSNVLRMPDVILNEKAETMEEETPLFENGCLQALQALEAFRIQEGMALQQDLTTRIGLIKDYLEQIGPYETQRVDNCRSRLEENLARFIDESRIDRTRFEQELIYYLEKLDITEEKVRLNNHCVYFLETMNEPVSTGKKLGFIIQEIGREINTIGSKANELHIQQLVVRMKDELEKIREQSMNIL